LAVKKNSEKRNPAAVALGKLGGSKGGNARKRTTPKERLSEIGFIGSVYGRIARGVRVPKEEIELARRL